MEYIPAKTIVTRTRNRGWFNLEYNMNIYRGCCHGCIYCDSRSDCYQNKDFDQVKAKENALQIIRDDLRRKVRTGVIGTGSMSDPYNPYEKELCLTRHALELTDAFGFGIAIATKSTLLLRDIDILNSIREHSPVLCKITITTADDELSKQIEPGAPCSSERFQMIETLTAQGIFAGILLMPVLPWLEDSEENVLAIVRRAHQVGARFIYAGFGVTLRDSQRVWYFDQLDRLFPERQLTKQYISRYGNQYDCRSPKASALWKVFAAECEKLGILYRMNDIIHAYRRTYEITQLNLFDI